MAKCVATARSFGACISHAAVVAIAVFLAVGGVCVAITHFDLRYKMQAAYNFWATRVRWLNDAACYYIVPGLYVDAEKSGTQMHAHHKQPATRGVVVFLHGIDAVGWWQWRNVLETLRWEDALSGYLIYAPTLLERGNTNAVTAAEPVVEQIMAILAAHFADAPADIVFVGTSMGARIAAHVEIGLSNRLPPDRVRKLVFVSLAGLFGPTQFARLPGAAAIMQTLGYNEHVIDAATLQHPHDAIMAQWRRAATRWNEAHYHFIASEEDEVIPARASLPWPEIDRCTKGLTTKHTVFRGVDHAGIVHAARDVYIPWIRHALDDAPAEPSAV